MGNKPSSGAGGQAKSNRSQSAINMMGDELLRVVEGIKKEKSSAELKSHFDSLWSRYDTDGNGYLDTDEGTKFVVDFMKLMAQCRKISYDELVRDLSRDPESGSTRTENEVIRLFFALVDIDDDGMISREEFENYIRNYLPV